MFEDAWKDVEDLQTWQPEPIDTALLEGGRALHLRYGLSWWDSLVVAAAERTGGAILLSEDLNPSQSYGNLRVVNPFAETETAR